MVKKSFIEISDQELSRAGDRLAELLKSEEIRKLGLDLALAYYGYQINGNWSDALIGPIAMRLCEASGNSFGIPASQSAGVALLAALGLLGSAGQREPLDVPGIGSFTPPIISVGPGIPKYGGPQNPVLALRKAYEAFGK